MGWEWVSGGQRGSAYSGRGKVLSGAVRGAWRVRESGDRAPFVVDDVDVRDVVQRDRNLALALLVAQRVVLHHELQRPPTVRPRRLLRTHGSQQQLRLLMHTCTCTCVGT